MSIKATIKRKKNTSNRLANNHALQLLLLLLLQLCTGLNGCLYLLIDLCTTFSVRNIVEETHPNMGGPGSNVNCIASV